MAKHYDVVVLKDHSFTVNLGSFQINGQDVGRRGMETTAHKAGEIMTFYNKKDAENFVKFRNNVIPSTYELTKF